MKKKIAILFDMDGVLVDSEPVILSAAMAGLREYGVEAKPDDFLPFIGAGEDRFIGGVAEKHGVAYRIDMKKRVYDIYLEIVDGKLEVYDGTIHLLEKLRAEGYPMVLASSADRVKIDANLKVAGIDHDIFNGIIGGEDVANKKPHPEIYLKAAAMINYSPDSCIVVEDAVNGIMAAKAAGMKSIGVTTSFSSKELVEVGADYICSAIENVYQIIESI